MSNGAVRPISSAYARARSTRAPKSSSVSSCGVFRAGDVDAGFGNGHQPSAASTARRIARRLLPPIQMGGHGCCTGRGRIVVPRDLK